MKTSNKSLDKKASKKPLDHPENDSLREDEKLKAIISAMQDEEDFQKVGRGMRSGIKLTMAIRPGLDGWYVGQIVEIPGVLTQGKTVGETKFALIDALSLYLEVEREDKLKEFSGKDSVLEELSLV